MSILDIDNTPPTRTAAIGAKEVRRALLQAIRQVDRSLERVRSVVNEFGRSAVGTELAPDGADLLTIYNGLKDVLTDASVGRSVDDLPA